MARLCSFDRCCDASAFCSTRPLRISTIVSCKSVLVDSAAVSVALRPRAIGSTIAEEARDVTVDSDWLRSGTIGGVYVGLQSESRRVASWRRVRIARLASDIAL